MKGFKGTLSATLDVVLFIATTVFGCVGVLFIGVAVAAHNTWAFGVTVVPTYACLRTSYTHYCRMPG